MIKCSDCPSQFHRGLGLQVHFTQVHGYNQDESFQKTRSILEKVTGPSAKDWKQR